MTASLTVTNVSQPLLQWGKSIARI